MHHIMGKEARKVTSRTTKYHTKWQLIIPQSITPFVLLLENNFTISKV
jgi:hypothetical protein